MPNDHYFIHKGVVFSDRSPKPHYPEAKRAYQWIGIEPGDLSAGTGEDSQQVCLHHPRRVPGLLDASPRTGEVIDKGNLWNRSTWRPGRIRRVTIPVKKIAPVPGAEYFLRVSFALAQDELWAKAGYEVAAAQFKLPIEACPHVGRRRDAR